MEQQAPRLIIVAGANGSGKTTFAVPYTKAIDVQFLNADELAKRYADRGDDNAMIKGGREFFRLLNRALGLGEDVVIETTLSGSYTSKVARRARRNGYVVEVVYIFLEAPELCVQRVALRVKKGGHDVPTGDIIRRYSRSILNFKQNFMNSVDVWLLYFNGIHGFELVASKNEDQQLLANPLLFEKFQNLPE